MAINESNFLRIRKGKSSYLLLRGFTHFHLVQLGPDLSTSKMNRLLQIYPCDTDQLHKLGIHFSAFKADSLRGVVIKGYSAGDSLELWLGADVREYQIDADYSDDRLSEFFSGRSIIRRRPAKWEGLDPHTIQITTWVINSISFLCAALFFFERTFYKLWSSLCIFCLIVSLAVVFVYPTSFTLAEKSKRPKYDKHKGKGRILPAFLVSIFALCLRTLTDFTYFGNAIWNLFLLSTIVAILVYAVYIWCNKNVWNGTIVAIAVIATTGILCLGPIGQLNYLLDRNTVKKQTVTVVDKSISRGVKATRYYCSVKFSNGEIVELSLSGRKYSELSIGDNALVTQHQGCFHIPFSILGPEYQGG